MNKPAFLVAATVLLVPAASAAPIYYVTNLGSFGGDASIAYAIASNGSVAGGALTAQYEKRAFLYERGTARDLDGVSSQANALNASGAVAGTSYAGGNAQAVVWSGGARTELGTLGGTESEAMGINFSGAVVGRAETTGGQGHAFLWSEGRMEDLGALPGGSWSSAYSINDDGQIAGYGMAGWGFFRAFVRNPGLGLSELGTLGGWNSYAFGINSSGEVAGHSSTAAGWVHAYLYSDGLMRDLGTLGGMQSYAYGINTSGAVVGHSWLAGSNVTHAYVYRNGWMTDLNTLIDPASGWELLEAYGINDSGQIAGMGLYNGQALAYRLDPALSRTTRMAGFVLPPAVHTPEPGTMVLFGLGLVAALADRLRSHRR